MVLQHPPHAEGGLTCPTSSSPKTRPPSRRSITEASSAASWMVSEPSPESCCGSSWWCGRRPLSVCSSAVSEPEMINVRVVGGRLNPTEWTFENYDTVFGASASGSLGGLTVELVRHHDSRHDHPHRRCRLRRLRLRMDRLQRAASRSSSQRSSLLAIPLQVALIPLLQTVRRAVPSLTLPFLDKTIAILPRPRARWTPPRRSWLDPHCGFALPFAIFLLHNYISPRSPRICSKPLASTAPTTSPSSGGSCPAALGARPRRVRHLPVPVDVERLPHRQHVRSAPTPDQPARPPSSSPTSPATLVGTRPFSLPAAGFVQAFVPLRRFLRSAALLRPRHSWPAPSRGTAKRTSFRGQNSRGKHGCRRVRSTRLG